MTEPLARKRRGLHPYQQLSDRQYIAAFVVSLVLALVARCQMRVDAKTPTAPHGTLSLALAGTRKRARAVLWSWGPRTRQEIDRNLRFDPLFSAGWTNVIALACVAVAAGLHASNRRGARLGVQLAWSQPAAATLSTAKSLGMIAVIRGRDEPAFLRLVGLMTIVEIGLKSSGLLYAVAGIVIWLVDGFRRRRAPTEALARRSSPTLQAGGATPPC